MIGFNKFNSIILGFISIIISSTYVYTIIKYIYIKTNIVEFDKFALQRAIIQKLTNLYVLINCPNINSLFLQNNDEIVEDYKYTLEKFHNTISLMDTINNINSLIYLSHDFYSTLNSINFSNFSNFNCKNITLFTDMSSKLLQIQFDFVEDEKQSLIMEVCKMCFAFPIVLTIVSTVFFLFLKTQHNNAKSMCNNLIHDILSPVSIIMNILDKNITMTPYKSNIIKTQCNILQNRSKVLNETICYNTQEKTINISEFFTWFKDIHEPLFYFNKINFILVNNIQDTIYLNIHKDKLQRCLENLLSNSLKYTKYGYIKICVSNIHDMINITISDTGQGIPKNLYKKIFQKGFSFNSHSGFGIGLHFTKQHITNGLHGDIICYDNKESPNGVTFEMNIPISINVSTVPIYNIYNTIDIKDGYDISYIDQSVHNVLNVLLIEDDYLQMNLLIEILEKQFDDKINIVDTCNGKEAIEIIKKEQIRFHVIITDLYMPVMDGCQFIQEFSKFEFTKKPIIICRSAHITKHITDKVKNLFNDAILLNKADGYDIIIENIKYIIR